MLPPCPRATRLTRRKAGPPRGSVAEGEDRPETGVKDQVNGFLVASSLRWWAPCGYKVKLDVSRKNQAACVRWLGGLKE